MPLIGTNRVNASVFLVRPEVLPRRRDVTRGVSPAKFAA